jgi:AcrR family transcriptional regulator
MPKIVDHDQYRRELLAQCLELFTRKGYANVTIREIANELGVSTGTLYHYFPTKQAIFEQLFEQERTRDVTAVMQETLESKSRVDRINSVIDHWDENREYYHNIVSLAIDFHRHNRNEVSYKVMKEYSDFYRTSMSSIFDLPVDTASFMFIFAIGLMYHSLVAPDAVDFRRQLELMKKMVLLLGEAEEESHTAENESAPLRGE